MANQGPSYGMSAAVSKKIQGKRDPAQEEQVKQWIEAVIGEKFNAAKSFEENLKDGIILCKLINKIRPGSVKKIQESTMPFKQMENIQAFQEGIKKYGVAENEVFQTVDLYEKKDINQVTLCLLALTRACTRNGWTGPSISLNQGLQNMSGLENYCADK